MSIKSLIPVTALMAAAMQSKMFMLPHAGGFVSIQFDYGSIVKARRNNQRNKNQKRLRGIGRR